MAIVKNQKAPAVIAKAHPRADFEKRRKAQEAELKRLNQILNQLQEYDFFASEEEFAQYLLKEQK